MNTDQWIEQFTGLKVATGASVGPDPELATKALEDEAKLKERLLADAHLAVQGVQKDFQKAMASEIKIQGHLFKQRMLEIKGTQIDEADFDEIDFSVIQLKPETELIIKNGSNLIQLRGERLATTMVPGPDGDKVLFKDRELEDGYWFPLTRERILPETFIGALYSKTQRMLDETNAAYLAAVEVKREKGQLTPDGNRIRDLVRSSAEMLTIGADLAGGFAPGSENAALAGNIMTMMSKVVAGGGDLYDKVKAKEYADGASSVLGTMKMLTSSILGLAGIDASIIKLTEKGFDVGGAAITAGKHFARGADGAGDGMGVLGGVLQSALEIAAGQVPDARAKEALKAAAISSGMGLKAAGNSANLVKALHDGDTAAAIDCMGQLATTTLNGVQDLRKLTETRGKSKEEAERISKRIDEETRVAGGNVALGTTVLKTGAIVAIGLKRGTYQKAFDALIDGIGDGLTQALTNAGLPEDTATKIGLLYKSGTYGAKALEAMMAEDPNVEGALLHLGAGFSTAFGAVAPGNDTLVTVGKSMGLGFQGLADAAKVRKLYAQGKYDEAMTAFIDSVQSQIGGVFDVTGLAPGSEDGTDSGGDSPGESTAGDGSALKNALLELTNTVKNSEELKTLIGSKVDDALEDQVTAEALAEAHEEALAILAEAKADISEAEQLGRDAADIDKLIAKMQRDQLVMQIALQIAQGGAAFLASFIPAMGIASAGIKMMASLCAAAQRAQQLAYWVDSRSDLAAAQSALTSSAQNFVKNQADQFAHHSIQAAFAAAEMIGSALRVAGAASFGAAEAAGAGLMVAAKAGAKLEEIIQRHKKAEELERAWKLTKRSLLNPTNRKLGLRARALNPTLAKYSIAWGAVNLKDPLARNALRACDLTEAVLENENANVDKVVEYLETFYDEDDQLYRELEKSAKWVPADLTLTLRSWTRLKKGAVDNIKLANPDTGVIDGYLAQIKVDLGKLDDAGLVQRIALLHNIGRALQAYVPQAKNPEHVKQFQTAQRLLGKQCEAAIKAAGARREKLAKAQQDQDDKDVAARNQALAEGVFALGELQTAMAGLEALEDGDSLEDMRDEYEAAASLLKDIAGIETLKGNVLVQSHATQLREQMATTQRLIDMTEMAPA